MSCDFFSCHPPSTNALDSNHLTDMRQITIFILDKGRGMTKSTLKDNIKGGFLDAGPSQTVKHKLSILHEESIDEHFLRCFH